RHWRTSHRRRSTPISSRCRAISHSKTNGRNVMATIGFIGLGNMGGPMARNLVKAGHKVRGFDAGKASAEAFAGAGGETVASAADAAKGVEVVITMLPAGQHVQDVYMGAGKVIASAAKGTLLIDCSTIDVETAREVSAAAAKAGQEMVDAPVSG